MKYFCKIFDSTPFGQIAVMLKPTEELGDVGPEVRVSFYLDGTFQSFAMGFDDDEENSWDLACALLDALDEASTVRMVNVVADQLRGSEEGGHE